MYSRNYYPDEIQHPPLPDNYDGTAFTEPVPPLSEESTISDNEGRTPVSASPLLGGLFSKLPLPFPDGISMPKIGTEELLIIAVAAFLLFSKNGDIECALILLFLLFIN